MARWTTNKAGGLKGHIDYTDGEVIGESLWTLEQDEKPFLEHAKLDRENAQYQKKDLGYKKFATIPEIVAIEIKEKYGIDLHCPTMNRDTEKMAKFMAIIKSEYAYLMSY